LEIQPGFQPPEEVPGWLTVEEGALLWEHAAGRRVLELGTTLGRSTVCLAQQARHVVTIDRRDQAEAREWCRRFQLHDRVVFRQGEVEQITRNLEDRFDLVFVDTEQDEASVRRDIEAALRVLEPNGQIAVHDYPDPSRPDVRRVVDEYAHRLGWRRIAQANFRASFVFLARARSLSMDKRRRRFPLRRCGSQIRACHDLLKDGGCIATQALVGNLQMRLTGAKRFQGIPQRSL
jgi:protein-L-isoaspartate O-methyltransferase